jgi:hypothetical protein
LGFNMPAVEIALHVLFVGFLTVKQSRHRWDVVTTELQVACIEHLATRMRLNDGQPAELAAELVTKFHCEHAERYLLAYVNGYLGEHDLLKMRTDAKTSLLLAVLNLVECIAPSRQCRQEHSCTQLCGVKIARLDAHDHSGRGAAGRRTDRRQ